MAIKPRVSNDLFRERVTQVLAKRGLSHAEFARRTGLDRSTLSQLLTSPMPRLPRAETLAAIATAAHVSVDWLLGLSQREEVGAEIVDAMIHIEPYLNSPAAPTFLAWLKAAQGSRVCSVPIAMPDLIKTDEVLRLEYASAYAQEGMTPTEAIESQIETLRVQRQPFELCASAQGIRQFARGDGRFARLSPASRREQLDHMLAVAESLYPLLRIHLYDADQVYSVPFTVFGTRRAAVFLGSSYLLLNSAAHIDLFSQRFDDLVRAAIVQPHEFGPWVRALADAM